ncbi:MAG: hypothetical protein AW12_02387 [Candidatus Accumulibacter sp. BA-94]|nr:MAG: hypothetical protein AW12_02387 [Candidatus Accumulibacter sp. BA-94]
MYSVMTYVLGNDLLRTQGVVDRKILRRQQLFAVEKVTRAQAGDTRGDVEDAVRDLAGDQIGLITLGHGNQQVGVLQAGVGEHGRMRTVADDRAQVHAVLQVRQALVVAIDHRDVVILGNKTFGNTRTDLAGTENDDPHFYRSP